MKRKVFTAIAVTVFMLAGQLVAKASLTLLQPDPSTPATFVGNGGYSADGLGQDGTIGGTMQAEVPAGSTVEQAYLYATYNFFQPDATARTLDFDGTVYTLDQIGTIEVVPGFFLSSARANVTTQVAGKVALGPGPVYDFAMNTDPATLDGTALVVIFSNPSLPETTIAVLDGEQATTGDSLTFNFAAPLDKTVPGFSAIMSLGIGFSFQNFAPTHECGQVPQYSTVDVNGTRMTSCAGDFDDGQANNDALITVGGVGDDLLNPADPNQTSGDGALPRVQDDELYNIEPFLTQGDTQLVVSTLNPSNDDGIFLDIVAVTARAAVTTEDCDNGVDDDGDQLIDGADPDCAPPPVEICGNGIDDDGDGQIDEGCAPEGQRMTGGGTLKAQATHHGFQLHCKIVPGQPNRLQVNWGKGNKFHLEELTSADCSDDPAISEGKPAAGKDTYTGAGSGRYNGVSGATAEWTFSDAGEPGKKDKATIVVRDAGNNVVLNVTGTLTSGNHQAHAS